MNSEEQKSIKLLQSLGYIVQKISTALPGIPDREAYRPFVNSWSIFSPWEADPTISSVIAHLVAKGRKTLVSRDRLWVLMQLARQAQALDGEYWEAGVYQGGTASLLHAIIRNNRERSMLRLFDTFSGMPETDSSIDKHSAGDFADTSIEAVKQVVGEAPYIDYRRGVVPETFTGLESARVAFAHIDLDIYPAILAACEFIYPRLAAGGFMIFDDYGFHSCPGARKAVDEFFADTAVVPLSLPTGQAIVFKSQPTVAEVRA